MALFETAIKASLDQGGHILKTSRPKVMTLSQ